MYGICIENVNGHGSDLDACNTLLSLYVWPDKSLLPKVHRDFACPPT